MLKIEIQASTVGELKAQLIETAYHLGGPVEVTGGSETKSAQPSPTTKKRGRPATKKVEAEAPAGATTAPPPSSAPSSTPAQVSQPDILEGAPAATGSFSKEDVATALRNLNTKKGMSAALAALSKFGAKKFSDLTPENYSPFVNHVEEVLSV